MNEEPPPSDARPGSVAHHGHVVEILLPLYDSEGTRIPGSLFDEVSAELTDLFGGVTAFVRSPAVGGWRDLEGKVERDDVVLFEVMTGALDQRWWARYRVRLERRFGQKEIMVRATSVERL